MTLVFLGMLMSSLFFPGIAGASVPLLQVWVDFLLGCDNQRLRVFLTLGPRVSRCPVFGTLWVSGGARPPREDYDEPRLPRDGAQGTVGVLGNLVLTSSLQ